MALEPEGNGEICSVTGTEANARFENGLGFAWYESRHDLSNFVDVSGRYDGPVCDDVIDRAIEAGEIFVYGWQSGGHVPPEDLPEEASAMVFAAAAMRQAALIANPPERTPSRIGRVHHVDATKLGAPRWLAPLSRFGGKSDMEDPEFAGSLWALSTLANGEQVGKASARFAGAQMHAFVVAARAHARETEAMLLCSMSEIVDADDEPSAPSGP